MKFIQARTPFASNLLWRVGGVAVIASMTVPLAGCGSKQPPPPVDAAPGQMAPAPQAQANTGMSTSTKLKVLAGAAAAYYLYKKYQSSQAGKAAAAQNVQYYVSKSTGRVYYRDPKNNMQAVWVTPPPNQIQPQRVPADEAAIYSKFKGYDNQQTGQGLNDVFSVR